MDEGRKDLKVESVGYWLDEDWWKRKCGGDAEGEGMAYLHVRVKGEGTWVFPLDLDEFRMGWNSPREKGVTRQEEAILMWQRCHGKAMHPYMEDALLRFAITPELLSKGATMRRNGRVSKTSGRRLKEAKPRKGGWGGRRIGSGRKPRG